jgi:hypothetical protein
MLGVPRFWASTLMCASGVWNSAVMVPLHTDRSLGTVSSTAMSRNERYLVPEDRSCSEKNRSCPMDVPRFRGW